MISQHSNIPPT